MADDLSKDLKAKLADRWWRLNNLYWVLDPYGRPVKFRPNVHQRRYLENRHYLDVILKARQLGFSTAIQIDGLDRCLFNSHWHFGIIADSLDLAQDIFESKIKFAFDRLPEPIRRARKPKQDSARSLVFANGSRIRVDTSHRGGTLQQLHVSELGEIAATRPDKAREIKTGAFNTIAPGQIITVESTAKGQEGVFFDLTERAREQTEDAEREGRDLGKLEWRFHFFPWWRESRYVADPSGVTIPAHLVRYFRQLKREHGIDLTEGQKAWYTLKQGEQGREEMLQEFPSVAAEAFQASVEGAYYANLLREMRQDGKITRVPYDENLLVHTAWDLGLDDAMAIWFFQIIGRECRLIDYLEDSDEGLEYYVEELRKRDYRYGRHFAPHDIEVRNLDETARSRKSIAADLGLHFETVPRVSNQQEGVQAVRSFLPHCYFDESACADGLKALSHYRKEWDAKRGKYKAHPLHNWASHGAKAFETLARAGVFQPQPSRRPVKQRGMGAWT